MTEQRPKTLFVDIDGTILLHRGSQAACIAGEPVVLPGVTERLDEWDRRGYRVILVTGRRECDRARTEAQLHRAGIFYDQLVMGVGGGQRVLINDAKPNDPAATASAITVDRNGGLERVQV